MSSTCYISTNQHTKKAVKFTSLVLVLVLMLWVGLVHWKIFNLLSSKLH